jgi:mono/diheme cytochrome c family protein
MRLIATRVAVRATAFMLVVSTSAACRSEAKQNDANRSDVAVVRTAPRPATVSGADRPASADPSRGHRLYGQAGCNGCHTIDGVGGSVGPEHTGIASRPSRDPTRWPTTEEYLRASITEPQAFVLPGYTPIMPSAETLQLSPQDVEDLVGYLKTLQ